MIRFLLIVATVIFGLPAFAAKPQAKAKANQTNTDDMWVAASVPELPAGVTHHTLKSASMKRDTSVSIAPAW